MPFLWFKKNYSIHFLSTINKRNRDLTFYIAVHEQTVDYIAIWC